MNRQEAKKQTEKYVTEYMKCKKSFAYFCANYIYIEVPGEDRLLVPYQPQTELIKLISKNRYVLVLKSRQIGISTIVQGYIAWLCCFHKNVVVGIISKDAPEATDFARIIMGMIDKFPDWLRPKFHKRTERTFILSNGCKCYASPVNPQAPEKTLRGKAITFLVIDEAAFVKSIDEAWTGMVPALSTNQMAAKKIGVPYGTVILSTPNKTVGVGKWFFERYTNAISGNDIFVPFVIHWTHVSELASNPEWYSTQCQLFNHDERKIQQELELKFLPTSGSFFDEAVVKILQDHKVEPMEKIKLFNGEAWKFSSAIPDRHYIIGVDTAPEHGEDKSAITVWDYQTLEQVWEFQGKCKVQDFIKVVKFACASYPGTVVVENNSYGNQVVEELNSSEYMVMLYQEKVGENRKLKPGISTNVKTRPLMIDALYSYITQYPEIVKSERLALELIGLVSKNSGKVEADTGCHDDLALAASFAFFVRKYDPPMMLESTALQGTAFNEIMGCNDISTFDTSNAAIMKEVKKNIEKHQGFVNVFDVFSDSL